MRAMYLCGIIAAMLAIHAPVASGQTPTPTTPPIRQ